jgi:virginiamycin B lyase
MATAEGLRRQQRGGGPAHVTGSGSGRPLLGPFRRTRSVLVAGLVLCCAWLVGVAGAATITEFSITTFGGSPVGITTGPDGALWFTEQNANKIGRITTAGTITEFAIPTAGSFPEFITTGPDGALWFTELNGNKIGRITTAGAITEFAIPSAFSSTPVGITAGPDGALWFTEQGLSRIGRITTAGTITEFNLPTSGVGLVGITAGPDGALWFAESGFSLGNKIGRITLAGTITEFSLPTPPRIPSGITAGPDGALWFTETGCATSACSGNKIGRITTAGAITEFPLPTASSFPSGITAGPDGALWFTERAANKIGRITTVGAITEFAIPTAFSSPVGITVGPDGALWFTEGVGNKIGRIVPDVAVAVSPGHAGDALIFPLIETTNLDTLLAIENGTNRTALHKVRFRDAATGASVLEFELCLVPGSTWTATVHRDGSVTRVTSASTLLVNGSATPLNATFSPDSTRAYLEVIGLRGTTSPSSDTAICTDPLLGGDVANTALLGKAYYVNGSGSPPLVYGASALALKDFSAVKIADGTVFGSDPVALALIGQGTGVPGSQSIAFGTRYFVPASFGAVTQVVLTFPTGPNSVGCPSCRVPSNISIAPVTEPGAPLPIINLPSDTSLVRVISLSSSDIANDAGVLSLFETSTSVSIPLVGFGINTTTAGAPLFFNALFPIGID